MLFFWAINKQDGSLWRTNGDDIIYSDRESSDGRCFCVGEDTAQHIALRSVHPRFENDAEIVQTYRDMYSGISDVLGKIYYLTPVGKPHSLYVIRNSQAEKLL